MVKLTVKIYMNLWFHDLISPVMGFDLKKKYSAQIEAVQQLAIEYKDYNIIT